MLARQCAARVAYSASPSQVLDDAQTTPTDLSDSRSDMEAINEFLLTLDLAIAAKSKARWANFVAQPHHAHHSAAAGASHTSLYTSASLPAVGSAPTRGSAHGARARGTRASGPPASRAARRKSSSRTSGSSSNGRSRPAYQLQRPTHPDLGGPAVKAPDTAPAECKAHNQISRTGLFSAAEEGRRALVRTYDDGHAICAQRLRQSHRATPRQDVGHAPTGRQ